MFTLVNNNNKNIIYIYIYIYYIKISCDQQLLEMTGRLAECYSRVLFWEHV